ncbi:hypothetical protein BDN72DRAFT_398687 [Pluteus cervinus]|uniref:Uncharacterized protein n=1 Tax=Pluteus cervinus TaxID=181527 RepID=A0ACD3A9A6_9AGAR|nr:hypothetical protein BDN72DRAFT_398687 [Pluteus cervinus]
MDHGEAARRLFSVYKHTNYTPPQQPHHGNLITVLPSGETVTSAPSTTTYKGPSTQLLVDSTPISTFRSLLTPPLAYDVTAIGTKFEGSTEHIPQSSVVEISAPKAERASFPIPNLWITIYGLFGLYPTDEHIPLVFSDVANEEELRTYLLKTGLGRLYQGTVSQKPFSREAIYLSRGAFWQGAGCHGYHNFGWLRRDSGFFPSLPSFTRNELVIASHPLRPPKPEPGQVVYKRWCAGVGQSLEFVHFDVEGLKDKEPPKKDQNGIALSQHLQTFHKWHNDERVNAGWGEKGTLQAHRDYIVKVMGDPGVIACMMCWDGQLMGYVEIVWVKENHVAQHYPTGVVPGDWERGIHVLVGESKFAGAGRAEIWIRSLCHYLFLADPRTYRVIGEPREDNIAIIKTVFNSEFHIETKFDFPYKRSVLVLHPRDRFFKSNRLHL